MFKNNVAIATLLLFTSISVKTGVFEAHIQQASDAMAKKDANLALRHYLAASELNSHSNAQLLLNIAQLYEYKGKLEESTDFYKRCLVLEPNNVPAMRGYACCLVKEHKLFDAITIMEKCIRIALLNKDNLNAYYSREDLFKLYLKSGQFKKAQSIRPIKLWWYDENISGKSILLDIDAGGNGFGDMFQYVRYAKILKENGAQVTVRVRQPLHPLLSLCPYIDRIIEQKPDLSLFDKNYNICIATLMILTHQKTDYEVPHAYLYASKELQELWRKKMNSTELNVGLCWEGSLSLDDITRKYVFGQKSIHAKEFSILKDTPGIRFFSLQKQIQHKPDINISYFDNDFDVSHGAYMDTAALIKNLDLVITIDTSIAHLAGALGVPVWLMLLADCDFRWLENTTHTMWYPTMRLFRQKKYGDWATVITEIKQELINLQLMNLEHFVTSQAAKCGMIKFGEYNLAN